MHDELPQLRMSFSHFDDLVLPRAIPGYGMRTFRPGDEDDWIGLLSIGEFGEWDRARLDRMLGGERAPLALDGAYFATHEDRPVGAACVFLHPDADGPVPELGWVAVRPEHRGRGLGLQVCSSVLRFVGELRLPYVYLLTEDFRLPAIATYLRLGFEPEMVDVSHPARWEALRRALGRVPP